MLRADITVADLPELATVYVTDLAEGANAWVEAEGDYWTLEKTSGAAPGLNVLAPLPGAPTAGAALARWLRQTGGGGGGVISVGVTAPIVNTGTLANPVIGITPATTIADGSMTAADKQQLVGLGYANRVPFTYLSGTLLLQALLAGDLIDRAAVLITTPFDGVGGSVHLGTTVSPNLIFAPGDVTVGVANTYDNSALEAFSIPGFLQLVVVPGTATQGAGVLFYTLRR